MKLRWLAFLIATSCCVPLSSQELVSISLCPALEPQLAKLHYEKKFYCGAEPGSTCDKPHTVWVRGSISDTELSTLVRVAPTAPILWITTNGTVASVIVKSRAPGAMCYVQREGGWKYVVTPLPAPQ